MERLLRAPLLVRYQTILYQPLFRVSFILTIRYHCCSFHLDSVCSFRIAGRWASRNYVFGRAIRWPRDNSLPPRSTLSTAAYFHLFRSSRDQPPASLSPLRLRSPGHSVTCFTRRSPLPFDVLPLRSATFGLYRLVLPVYTRCANIHRTTPHRHTYLRLSLGVGNVTSAVCVRSFHSTTYVPPTRVPVSALPRSMYTPLRPFRCYHCFCIVNVSTVFSSRLPGASEPLQPRVAPSAGLLHCLFRSDKQRVHYATRTFLLTLPHRSSGIPPPYLPIPLPALPHLDVWCVTAIPRSFTIRYYLRAPRGVSVSFVVAGIDVLSGTLEL